MLQKFLYIGKVPEIRSEPRTTEGENHEIELALPLEVYLEAQEVIEQIRYAAYSGISADEHFRRLKELLRMYILYERDRIWFIKTF